MVCEVIIVILMVMDECGNMSLVLLVLVVCDDIEFIFVGSFMDFSLDCMDVDFINWVDSIIMVYVGFSIVDLVSEFLIWFYSLFKVIVLYCGSYLIIYLVVDGCGNSIDFEIYFEVMDMVVFIFDMFVIDFYVFYDDMFKYNYLFVWLVDYGGVCVSDNCFNNL